MAPSTGSSTGTGIDVVAWKRARPAARTVRRRAALICTAAVLLAGAGAFAVDSLLVLLLASPAVGTVAWRVARWVLASRAVAAVTPTLPGLSAVTVAELVAYGRAEVGGGVVVAVEDQTSVVLTSAPGSGPGPQLPASVVVNLGGGDV